MNFADLLNLFFPVEPYSMGEECVAHLARILETNTTLTEPSLRSNNHIGDEGVA